MICPICKTKLPGSPVACPVCAKARYMENLQQLELELLPHIVAGKLDLRLLRIARSHWQHIGYQHGFTKEPYCGGDLHYTQTSRCAFGDRPRNLCSACVSHLELLLERAGILVSLKEIG